MMFKELARTGVQLPEIGIGTYDYHAGPSPLRKGLEAGALFIDTAESYGTEPVVGEAIRGMRNRVFLATKVSPEHFRAADLRRSVDASLLQLGVDQVDLLQLHHPNPSIPIQETMDALAGVIEAGKVRFCGVSNFSLVQMQEAQNALGKHPIVSNQVRYNIINRTIESSLLPYCQSHRITIIAYSPLAKSLGRILDCDPKRTIERIAQATGKTPAQIVINWCLCKDGVVTIPKGGSEEHVLENCAATGWRLTPEQLALLDATIEYRHRNRFDEAVRQLMPRSWQRVARRAVDYLPRSVRRRIL